MNNENASAVRLVKLEGSPKQDRNATIQANKFFSRIMDKAQQNTKSSTCYLCGNTCSSFCNSHSIPQFVLRRISSQGKVVSCLDRELNPSANLPGVKKAGTFQIICHDCDNTKFQKYEDSQSYDNTPSNLILAQIALKNYLHLISKRIIENEMYHLMAQRKPEKKQLCDTKIYWGKKDLENFNKRFEYAKASFSLQNRYHLCYYKVLDYVVPVAAQAAVTLLCDFNGQIINNIYDPPKNNHFEPIHIAVSPLKDKSVILLFVETGEIKNRRFYRQLNKLPEEDQLAAINYILFSYSEDVFVYGPVADRVQNDPSFRNAFTNTLDYTAPPIAHDPLGTAMHEYNLDKRSQIPNLLSRSYAIQ